MDSSAEKGRKEVYEMKGFQKLLDYYKESYDLIDTFHFNSQVTCDTYLKFIKPRRSMVIPITHCGIVDHRKEKAYDKNIPLRIGFIGSSAPYKGLPLLIKTLEKMKMHEKWRLDVWGGRIGKDKNLPIFYRGKFDHRAIEMVYTTMDTMVVPSQCHETFSLVTLEALSYGVPVIVSDTVGAKDVVSEYNPRFVYHSEEELKRLLSDIMEDRTLLQDYNQRVLDLPWIHGMEEHSKEVIEKIYNSK